MDTIILFIFAAAILGLIGSILGYQLLKYLKGNMDIIIPKKYYHFGEEIIGYVHLNTKQNVNSRGIKIHLILHEKQTKYIKGESRTTTVEVMRYTHEIEGKNTYLAGLKKDFDFRLLVPNASDIPDMNAENERRKLFSKYYSHFSRLKRFTWSLRVELDCEGVNLSARQTIRIENNIHNDSI